MSDDTSTPAETPVTDSMPPPPPEPPQRRRSLWRWLAAGVVVLLVAVAAGIGLVVWALTTPSGTAWVLSLAPGVTVSAPQGAFIGDFSAAHLEAVVPGTGRVALDAPRWQGLAIARGDQGRWLRLTIAALRVDRVVFEPVAKKPVTNGPLAVPTSLRLPVEVVIDDASIGELRIGGEKATPVRDLHARLHLGADGGAMHRFEQLQAGIDKARASGSATIAADPPFTVAARLELAGVDTEPAWQATLDASGPLAALNVAATARVAASAAHAPQSLDARAVVKPFVPWPLGELRASTSALDLSAFASAAPATSLSGTAVATTTALDQPAIVSLDIENARAGRYDEGLLPLRRLQGELRARPDDPSVLEVQSLVAELGSAKAAAGRITGQGRWTPAEATLSVTLQQVRPSLLDARAPVASIDGTVQVVGKGLANPADTRAVDIVAQLAGQLLDPALPRTAPRAARVKFAASATERAIDLRTLEATLGDAKASLSGRLARRAATDPWRATGKLAIVDLDPAPWWPGMAGTPLGRGANRLNGHGDFDLVLPAASPSGSPLDALNALLGQAALSFDKSTVAGLPFEGKATFANSDGRARPTLDLTIAGNHVSGQGQVAAKGSVRDEWRLAIDAPALAALAPLWAQPGRATKAPALAGSLTAKARVDGRWPELTSEGELHASGLRYDTVTVARAEGKWQLASAGDAKVDATLAIDGVASAGRTIGTVRGRLSGTARAHRAELRIESQALPPEWVDGLVAAAAASGVSLAASGVSSAASGISPAASSVTPGASGISPAASGVAPAATTGRSEVLLSAEGGLVDVNGQRAAGWRGRLIELVAHSLEAPRRTWLQARDVRGSAIWGAGPLRIDVEPGRAEALGATLRWSRVAYQGAADGRGAAGKASAARLDLQATIDPLPVAPILARLQPGFGWAGDLAVGARIEVHSTPAITASIVVERAGGDLVVQQDFDKQSLGLSDLRFGIAAEGGVWHFTVALAGSTLGVASGAVTARTSSPTAWPDAATPIEGVLELQVADLGTWGAWVPAGWRLGGKLHASASIGGRLGAPEYTGRLEGSGLSARNFLQGVNVTDGELAIALEGETARIERFTARGGKGTAKLAGEAQLGAKPSANLKLVADAFQLLGRVDRRIVASGNATMRLDAETIGLQGKFKVDEGLIDFTRADAPTLGDDVEVVRRPRNGASPAAETKALAATPVEPQVGRKVDLDLRIDMGEKLRIRGRGLDATLRGELHLTSPNGRLAAEGSIRAVDGTYQAYGQKLAINRAVITFVGPINNPRLDIEATRPDLDVRVGVVVAGTVLNPRIRLFSQPDMSDVDKLSWLVLGKASTSAGGTESALLQRAALALLSGEGPSTTDKVTKALGLDEFSVRSGEGGVKDTIVSVGKQISKRWYVGYERGLNSTTGSWQLIYRIAQRFTVKAQAGGDTAVDVNWTLRWK